MTSRRPCWCPKTMKRRPCWCPKQIPFGVKLFSYANASFCSNKFAWILTTWVKTLYILGRTTQIWVVIRHRYGISSVVAQTSFHRETNQWWRRHTRGRQHAKERLRNSIVWPFKGLNFFRSPFPWNHIFSWYFILWVCGWNSVMLPLFSLRIICSLALTPLNPKIKIWILICYPYSFPTEKMGRSW